MAEGALLMWAGATWVCWKNVKLVAVVAKIAATNAKPPCAGAVSRPSRTATIRQQVAMTCLIRFTSKLKGHLPQYIAAANLSLVFPIPLSRHSHWIVVDEH